MRDYEAFAIVGTIFLFVLPFILLIISKHQQKMAEIVHGAKRVNENEAALLYEVQKLGNLVAQQTILLDSISQQQKSLTNQIDSNQDVSQRLSAPL